jgi:hypothetical protein
VPLTDGGLVDVAGKDQLGAGVHEPSEHAAAVSDLSLARAPGCSEEVVVQDDDLESVGGSLGQAARRVLEVGAVDPASLVEPRSHGVQTDDVQLLRAVRRLRGLPVTLELLVGARESRDGRIRDVVIPGNGEDWSAEALEEVGGAGVLLGSSPMGQVAAGDDQFRVNAVDQRGKAWLDPRLLVRADVEVGEVKESRPGGGHRGGRLYTQIVVDEPTEIFDDLYLGLRAGGALRKKRRGEPLTSEEAEALGRWQRLSRVRKAITLGAFALGTFGLGFTIGGLIFGKWRRA